MIKLSPPTQYHTQACLIIGLQAGVLLLLTLLGSCYYGHHVGFSITCGGLTVILPTLYFAFKLFHKIQQKGTTTHLYHFYSGQIVKLLLSISLSLVMLIFLHAAFFPFLVGFLFTQMSIFLAPLLQTILRTLSF